MAPLFLKVGCYAECDMLTRGFPHTQGKAKYNAWKKEVDAGTTPEAAQKKYVELVEKLKNELGYNA